MGELGDWGYWLLVVLTIGLSVFWGITMREFKFYSNGWDAGYKAGLKQAEKERQRIDARI